MRGHLVQKCPLCGGVPRLWPSWSGLPALVACSNHQSGCLTQTVEGRTAREAVDAWNVQAAKPTALAALFAQLDPGGEGSIEDRAARALATIGRETAADESQGEQPKEAT